MKKPLWPVLGPLLGLLVVTLATTAWLFLYKKDYNFVVEAACNPSSENCFHRDCSDGSCPPDNLENYKVYKVNAAEFASCVGDTCAKECENGTAHCTQVSCGSSEEDSCTANPEASAQ